MKISVVQMSPGHARDANLAAMRCLVDDAAATDRPDLVILPEIWSCLGGDRDTKRAAAEPLPARGGTAAEGSLHRALSDLARRHAITLHAGSIGEHAGDRLYNTTLVFGPDGAELCRYRKIHLFDVVTSTGQAYRESDTYAAGRELALFECGETRVGCAICYDLRFPALFAALRERGASVIAIPAAFTAETGQAHWEPLLRARAIETQCWVAAAGTVGPHMNERGQTRHTHGHSLVCDPWGTVVAQAGPGVGFATARVDPSLTAQLRRDMPVWQHRVAL